MMDSQALQELLKMSCWPALIELDLRANSLPNAAFESLLTQEPPVDIAALVLTRKRNPQLGLKLQRKLQDHFRGAVVFADES